MKNKKIAILSFLLVAVLCVGIGFAALSDSLDIQGSAEVGIGAASSAFDEGIYFSNAVANEDGNVAAVVTGDPDKATFTASTLGVKNDTVTFTFTIQNDSEFDAKVTQTVCSTTNSDYFSCTTDWADAKTIAAGGSETITVTVTLLKTPTDPISGTFTVELSASTVA